MAVALRSALSCALGVQVNSELEIEAGGEAPVKKIYVLYDKVYLVSL